MGVSLEGNIDWFECGDGGQGSHGWQTQGDGRFITRTCDLRRLTSVHTEALSAGALAV